MWTTVCGGNAHRLIAGTTFPHPFAVPHVCRQCVLHGLNPSFFLPLTHHTPHCAAFRRVSDSFVAPFLNNHCVTVRSRCMLFTLLASFVVTVLASPPLVSPLLCMCYRLLGGAVCGCRWCYPRPPFPVLPSVPVCGRTSFSRLLSAVT